jgi:hypothetical protein
MLLIWNVNLAQKIIWPLFVLADAVTVNVPVGALAVESEVMMLWGPGLRGQGLPAFCKSAHTSPLKLWGGGGWGENQAGQFCEERSCNNWCRGGGEANFLVKMLHLTEAAQVAAVIEAESMPYNNGV